MRAPALVLGPSLQIDYRTIVVPVVRSAESEEALVAAARLAAPSAGRAWPIVHVLEIPMDLPLTASMPEAERAANGLLDDARAIVESYGVRAVTRLERAR